LACKYMSAQPGCQCSLRYTNPMIAECKKCGKILTSFVDPRQLLGPDKIIPPQVLANAKVRSIVHLPLLFAIQPLPR